MLQLSRLSPSLCLCIPAAEDRIVSGCCMGVFVPIPSMISVHSCIAFVYRYLYCCNVKVTVQSIISDTTFRSCSCYNVDRRVKFLCSPDDLPYAKPNQQCQSAEGTSANDINSPNCLDKGVLASRELTRGLATLPPPMVDPGAFSGQRQGWKTHNRTLWQCTASVCVAGVHCWEILELADPGNVIFCLSC